MGCRCEFKEAADISCVAALNSVWQDNNPKSNPGQKQGKKLYKDTNFADFLEYSSTQEPKQKDFLESRQVSKLEKS